MFSRICKTPKSSLRLFRENQAYMSRKDAESPRFPSETFSSPPIIWKVGLTGFVAFGVGLHMSGGFKGANAPFDEKRNAISVCLISGKEIKASVKALKPINVTEDTRWYLSGTLQQVPHEVWDQLVAEGPRRFEVTGLLPPVHPSHPDEGVWLEDDAGEKVAVATVVRSVLGHTDCTLEGPLERGDCWIVAQCRYLDEPDLIRCRRRIKVV